MSASKLRVVSLQAQNILRLSAIDIKWNADQSVLTLGGANGAGKSSAVNCVAMALGGKELCPEEPIKRGEVKGFVELDLGELRIRRDFWRESLPCDCGAAGATAEDIKADDGAGAHPDTCASFKYGDVKSRLVVRNADGITQGTPQAILDKLIGRMTFDPMAFVNEDPKRQEEILRRIVNLDVSQFELARKTAFERRAVFNRQHKDMMAVLDAMTVYDAPAEPVSFDEIRDEMKRAEELRQAARNAEVAVSNKQGAFDSLTQAAEGHKKRVDRLRQDLEEAEANLTEYYARIHDEEGVLLQLRAKANEAELLVPDEQALSQRLKDVEATNENVRANQARQNVANNVKAAATQAENEDRIITEAEASKRAALDAAKFPVPGLSLSEHGVTFNDLPFKQASTSEQIRVSVAIGFALHPKLKLLLVKNGNALDDDNLQLIAQEAAAADGQILMEYVTKDAADVSVFIEDGHQA